MDQAQEIWKMLDNLHANNPTEYNKFIKKQIKEGKEYMKPPEPNMSVKTKNHSNNSENVYINICAWNRVSPPKSEEDPIPVFGSKIYSWSEGEKDSKIVNVAFNPKVIEDFGIDSNLHEERSLLIKLALDYIEDMNKIKLSRDYILLPKSQRYFGDRDMVINSFLNKDQQNFFKEKDLQDIKLVNDLEETSNISIFPEHSTKPGLIEEIDNSENINHSLDPPLFKDPEYTIKFIKEANFTPQTILIKIKLPSINSVTECDLELTTKTVTLVAGTKYKLNLNLKENIVESKSSAKFNKKSSCLTLKLPTQ